MSIVDTASPASSLKVARWPAVLVRVALVVSIAGFVLLAAAGPGYRLRVLPLIPALLGAALGFVFCLLASVFGGIGWLAARRSARPQSRGSALRLGLAALVSVFAIVFLIRARGAPPIHDITTDVDDPPSFSAVLEARLASGARNPPYYQRMQDMGGKMLDVAAAQRRAYPGILPVDSSEPPAALLPLAEKAARDMGWRVVAIDPAEGRLEATDTTRYFGFNDDVAVRIRATPSGSRIDVRSESRVGLGDAGTNAHRVSAYLAHLRELMAHASAAH